VKRNHIMMGEMVRASFFISTLLVSLTVAVCSGNSNLGSAAAAASSQTKSYTEQTWTECHSRV